jgi:hypothetical protein
MRLKNYAPFERLYYVTTRSTLKWAMGEIPGEFAPINGRISFGIITHSISDQTNSIYSNFNDAAKPIKWLLKYRKPPF